MSRERIFNEIFSVVAEETDLTTEIIISKCNKQEIVDARYLLIYFLRREGFCCCSIALRLGMTPQGVCQIVRKFDDRRAQGGRIFEITFQRIRNELEKR